MYAESLNSVGDNELLLQLSEGSRDAFDVLYNRYWKLVFNTAFKRLNDMERSQDIAQDVFTQLWVRGSKSPIENLPAYLNVAARNGVFKHLEKEGRYAALPDNAGDLEGTLGNADAKILHEEFLEAFHQLIEGLPTQQRIIFKMRFEEDLSSQEIADRLQISPKTVRNQLGKALNKLRTSLMLFYAVILYYQAR
ncbi:RNA polymerase sigma factor [Pedobacter nyackensis]|uniref:RNA polymerase sigma-70 factor, ECF subfamily n=1 Tax=Pedobacter nyackensis TaxID=475255 RepID=A0A1W2EKV8_9SPHI|nr:sigma-70 family RNA polymerase sigma factor [Pedobacter nyackensis]SMD10359.1 RNA polymerase sigma-70 factor, ECF subfamily [Pedobacter nyackensis]